MKIRKKNIFKRDLNSVVTYENLNFRRLGLKDVLIMLNKRPLDNGVNFLTSRRWTSTSMKRFTSLLLVREKLWHYGERGCVSRQWASAENKASLIVNTKMKNAHLIVWRFFHFWFVEHRMRSGWAIRFISMCSALSGIVWIIKRRGLRTAGVKSTHQFLCFLLIVSYPGRHLVVALSIFKNIFVNN